MKLLEIRDFPSKINNNKNFCKKWPCLKRVEIRIVKLLDVTNIQLETVFTIQTKYFENLDASDVLSCKDITYRTDQWRTGSVVISSSPFTFYCEHSIMVIRICKNIWVSYNKPNLVTFGQMDKAWCTLMISGSLKWTQKHEYNLQFMTALLLWTLNNYRYQCKF